MVSPQAIESSPTGKFCKNTIDYSHLHAFQRGSRACKHCGKGLAHLASSASSTTTNTRQQPTQVTISEPAAHGNRQRGTSESSAAAGEAPPAVPEREQPPKLQASLFIPGAVGHKPGAAAHSMQLGFRRKSNTKSDSEDKSVKTTFQVNFYHWKLNNDTGKYLWEGSDWSIEWHVSDDTSTTLDDLIQLATKELRDIAYEGYDTAFFDELEGDEPFISRYIPSGGKSVAKFQPVVTNIICKTSV